MARPIKKGLDYFTHDVATSNERAVKFIESKYGITGYGIYFKILEKIYGEEGYYIHWKPVDECIYAAEWKVDVEFLRNLLADFFEIDLFSKWIYEANQVLTSSGIQRRYHEAVKKRPKYDGITSFCLINNSSGVINSAETEVNSAESAQRKGKESKDSIGEKKTKRFTPPTADQVNSYCLERSNGIDGQAFVNHYEAKGWMIGKNRMKDWQAAVRTWEARRKQEHGVPDLTPKRQKDDDEWQAIFSQT